MSVRPDWTASRESCCVRLANDVLSPKPVDRWASSDSRAATVFFHAVFASALARFADAMRSPPFFRLAPSFTLPLLFFGGKSEFPDSSKNRQVALTSSSYSASTPVGERKHQIMCNEAPK
jgi:hypothetical protein